MILTLWPSFPQTKRKQLITETENTEKQDGEPRDKHERSQLGLQFAELSTLPYWSVCVSVCECFRGGRVAAEPTGALWVVPSQVFSLCLDTSSAALPSVSLAVAHLILLFLHATFSSPVIYFTSMFTLHYVCSCSSNDGWQDRSEDSDNVMTSSLKAVRPRVSFHLKQNSRKMFLHPNEEATAILQPSHKNKC